MRRFFFGLVYCYGINLLHGRYLPVCRRKEIKKVMNQASVEGSAWPFIGSSVLFCSVSGSCSV